DDGSYGYCEETGDEIGLRRLEARPGAALLVRAAERRAARATTVDSAAQRRGRGASSRNASSAIARISTAEARPTVSYVGRFAPSPTGPLHIGSLASAVARFRHARQSASSLLAR